MEYRYKSTFTSIASVHTASEDEIKVAKASLEPLRSLLPAGIDPQESPDLLYISADGAVAGLANKNLDCITKSAAIAVHGSAKNKYINTEHNRLDVIGVVLYPALTKLDTHEILTPEEAAASAEPFNMSFAGVLWKTVSPMVTKYITQQDGAVGKDCLSISWEIGFMDYAIAAGDRDVSKARLIKPDDPSFSVYDKMLRQNGGEGKDTNGQELYRVIDGDAIILGYSVVPNPAAAVKGILPIEKANLALSAEATDIRIENAISAMDAAGKDAAEAVKKINEFLSKATNIEKSEEKSVTPSTASVTHIAPMKIENIEQLQAALAKHEAVAAVVDFVKAIQDASTKFAEDARAKEDLVKNAEAAKAENDRVNLELKASLAEVNKKLSEVRASQEAAVANQKFQERMSSFDEQFDLDDEDRKLIASDIKDLDDTAFESYAKKQSKLMCGKKKVVKKDKDPEPKDPAQAASEEAEAAKIKAALASVVEDKTQGKLPNTVVVTEDLKTKMAAAFAGSFRIDGETVSERQAKKSKK